MVGESSEQGFYFLVLKFFLPIGICQLIFNKMNWLLKRWLNVIFTFVPSSKKGMKSLTVNFYIGKRNGKRWWKLISCILFGDGMKIKIPSEIWSPVEKKYLKKILPIWICQFIFDKRNIGNSWDQNICHNLRFWLFDWNRK